MFERFTNPARQVVVNAQDESRRLKHDHIDTEHLLLGLLLEGQGLGARSLAAAGVTLERTRTEVARVVGEGSLVADTGQIPFTPEAKRALERAAQEASALGHGFVGTEHLLLGLLRDGGTVAERVLAGLGSTREGLRQTTLRLFGGDATTGQ